MGKLVIFSDQARADLRAIDQPVALQILKTLARHLESGEGDVKRLEAVQPPLLRLRSQDYRVLFRDHGTNIEVTRVRHRREAYR